MQGLVYLLRPTPAPRLNADQLEKNLLEIYRYRSLDDPAVYLNPNIQRLIQNVRASFLQLTLEALAADDGERASRVLDAMDTNIPEKVIPVRNKQLYRQITYLHNETGRPEVVRQRVENFSNLFAATMADSLDLAFEYGRYLENWDRADSILEALYRSRPNNGQLVGRLVQIYAQAGRNDQARHYLNSWLLSHPNDRQALSLLDSLQ